MKHPNAKKVQVLGMVFLTLHEAYPYAEVNMATAYQGSCGSPACHAGWFNVALGLGEVISNYMYGADRMAAYLGFANGEHLQYWAENNPKLWGNHFGYSMFSSSLAFGKLMFSNDTDLLTVKDIGNHWLKVADRLAAL